MLNLEAFESLLKTSISGRSSNNELWDSIDSTNARLLALAKDGAKEGTVVFARAQSQGRGRQGRQWISPPDSGLYMSLLLRPEKPAAEIPAITLAVGVACAKAILATTGVRIGLKWVNDLVYQGKKLGGILAEMQMNSDRSAIVIGIGINISFDAALIPEELAHRIIWLDQAAGTACDTNALAAEICLQMEDAYNRMMQGDVKAILDEWRAYSVTLGQEIVASGTSKELRGTAIDITESGALLVQTATGTEEIFGGEISI